jgi:hypothetical protein
VRSTVKPSKVSRSTPREQLRRQSGRRHHSAVEVPVSGSAYGMERSVGGGGRAHGYLISRTLLSTNVLCQGAGVLEFAKPAKQCGSSAGVYCGLAVNESVHEAPASPGSRCTDATGRVRSGGVCRPRQA